MSGYQRAGYLSLLPLLFRAQLSYCFSYLLTLHPNLAEAVPCWSVRAVPTDAHPRAACCQPGGKCSSVLSSPHLRTPRRGILLRNQAFFFFFHVSIVCWKQISTKCSGSSVFSLTLISCCRREPVLSRSVKTLKCHPWKLNYLLKTITVHTDSRAEW